MRQRNELNPGQELHQATPNIRTQIHQGATMNKSPAVSRSTSTGRVGKKAAQFPGIILALSNVKPEVEAEFNDWYEREAIPARLALPGFMAARRYHAVAGNFSHMAVYECESMDAAFSDAYRDHMNSPSEWRMRLRKNFRNVQWSVCQETWSTGSGMGGGAIIVQCSPIKRREAESRRYLAEQLAPRILQQGRIVRMALWEADAKLTAAADVTSRENLENYTNWVLFMETANLIGTPPSLHAELLASDSSTTGLLVGSIMGYKLLSAHHR